jgi:hypothetical protein
VTVIPLHRTTPADLAGPADLAVEQVKTLLAPINPSRVQNLRGQSHLEAWDVRRWLNRVFGFCGWSDETLELACVAQVEINPGRWTVVYRAQVRLGVKTTDGRVLSTWDDAAMGDSRNQPSLGDAHDQAMKTALSQALKRCAVNLGDQFGLSLYNDGSRAAVGLWSAAHTAAKPAEDVEAPAVPDDAPVKPEPAPVVEDQAPAAEQKVQRTKRAEGGPWETPQQGQQRPRAVPDQQAGPAGPSRDYLAAAQAAASREQFDQVRAAAVAEGAPPEYLAKLDAVAQEKEKAAQQQAPRQQHPNKPAGKKAAAARPAAVPSGPVTPDPEADAARQQHAVALAELLAAGQALALEPSHLDDIARAEAGCPAAECTVEQLTSLTADLRAAAEGAAA